MWATPRAKEALDGILKAFQEGRIGPLIAEDVLKAPNALIPCRKWSRMNRLLVYVTGSSDARGIRQWEQVGRRVRKGCKAVWILTPLWARSKKEATGETGEEAGPELEEKTKPTQKLIGFKGIPVFRMEDTEGDPLYPELAPNQPPPLMEVAAKFGLSVSYGPSERGEMGYFNPKGRRISLSSHDPTVFFHELAHAAHHRLKPKGLKAGQDAQQEAVAELTATALAYVYGMGDRTGNCWRYLQSYARGDGKSGSVLALVGSVIEETGQVLEEILKTEESRDEYRGLPGFG